MLVDVELIEYSEEAFIMSKSDFKRMIPIRIEKGFYDNATFNFDLWIKGKGESYHITMCKKLSFKERYPTFKLPKPIRQDDYYQRIRHDVLNTYGVCDSPQDFIKRFKQVLEKDKRKVVVAFTKVSKVNQPKRDGWRWHKWGAYIGRQKPTTEYLYDEEKIEEVYTFRIYRVV